MSERVVGVCKHGIGVNRDCVQCAAEDRDKGRERLRDLVRDLHTAFLSEGGKRPLDLLRAHEDAVRAEAEASGARTAGFAWTSEVTSLRERAEAAEAGKREAEQQSDEDARVLIATRLSSAARLQDLRVQLGGAEDETLDAAIARLLTGKREAEERARKAEETGGKCNRCGLEWRTMRDFTNHYCRAEALRIEALEAEVARLREERQRLKDEWLCCKRCCERENCPYDHS